MFCFCSTAYNCEAGSLALMAYDFGLRKVRGGICLAQRCRVMMIIAGREWKFRSKVLKLGVSVFRKKSVEHLLIIGPVDA